MRKQITKKQFINGTLWKIVETSISVGTSFVVSLILAILLTPEDFGVIALANVVINFSEILLQGAFAAPLIQKEEVDDSDYTSVMIFSLIASVFLYFFVFLLAPVASNIYHEEEQLTGVLRVISLIFIFQAVGSVRIAIISRNMQFKALSICTIVSSVISGAIGIGMAAAGAGVFALVIQKLAYQAFLNILLFKIIKWKPTFKGLSFAKIKNLLKFGSKVLGSSFVSYVSDSSISLVTARYYSVSALGYSSKGVQFPCDLSIFSFQAVATSLFPTLASYQNDKNAQKQIMRKVVSVTAFVLFPMMIGMLTVSERLILFLLKEKWIQAVPFMRIACIYYCATPFMLINVQLYHSKGNGKVRLFIETIKLVLTISCLLIGTIMLSISLERLFVFRTCIEVLIAAISIVGLKKAIGYSYLEYLSDLIKPLTQSIVMSVIIIIVGSLLATTIKTNDNFILMCQVFLGVVLYIIFSLITKPNGYIELKKIIKGKVKK